MRERQVYPRVVEVCDSGYQFMITLQWVATLDSEEGLVRGCGGARRPSHTLMNALCVSGVVFREIRLGRRVGIRACARDLCVHIRVCKLPSPSMMGRTPRLGWSPRSRSEAQTPRPPRCPDPTPRTLRVPSCFFARATRKEVKHKCNTSVKSLCRAPLEPPSKHSALNCLPMPRTIHVSESLTNPTS